MKRINPNLLKLAEKTYDPNFKPAKIEERVDEELEIKANINRKDYIIIPNNNILIGKREILHNQNWEQQHSQLADSGLFMPTPQLFMSYFLNVKEAAQGRTTLYDGNNNPIQLDEAKELWNYLSSTNRSPFNGKACWTYLDAKFVQGKKALELEKDHRVENGKLIPGKKVPLEKYLKNDGLASLIFNQQGLATTKSTHNQYQQGENIYFYYPRKDCVAWFDANSDGANLYCDWDSADSNSSLGVFSCAEGASRKILGGRK